MPVVAGQPRPAPHPGSREHLVSSDMDRGSPGAVQEGLCAGATMVCPGKGHRHLHTGGRTAHTPGIAGCRGQGGIAALFL